jgi:hypothetical protein
VRVWSAGSGVGPASGNESGRPARFGVGSPEFRLDAVNAIAVSEPRGGAVLCAYGLALPRPDLCRPR